MAEVAGIMTTIANLEKMNEQEAITHKQEQQKKQKMEQEKKRILASNRARQYASGISGRSPENVRHDIKTRYDHAIGNVAGAGGNTLGRINLLAKSVRDWGSK